MALIDKVLEVGLWGFLGYCLGQVVGVAIVCYTVYALITYYI